MNTRNGTSSRNRYGARIWLSASSPSRCGATTCTIVSATRPRARTAPRTASSARTTDTAQRYPESAQPAVTEAGRAAYPPAMPSDPATPPVVLDDGGIHIPDAGTTRLSGLALGIDVGGTGVKAALVDLATAELVSPRVREKTPQPATPEAVAETIRSVVGKVLEGREVPRTCRSAVACRAWSRTVASRPPRASTPAGSTGRPRERIGEVVGYPTSSSTTRMPRGSPRSPMGPVAAAGHGPAADPRHGHRQRPVPRRAPHPQHGVRAPRDARPGRPRRSYRARRASGASWAGSAGRASSTSTWHASSSTSPPTC